MSVSLNCRMLAKPVAMFFLVESFAHKSRSAVCPAVPEATQSLGCANLSCWAASG